MPIIGTFQQQPADILDYDVDFSDWLPVGDTITGATVVAFPVSLGLSYAIQGKRIKVWCMNGAVGVTYKVTVTVTTNDSRVKQVEFRLKVKED